MIYGIGIDQVSIDRIESILNRRSTRFTNTILTKSELDQLSNTKSKQCFVAKRFAAKEAFAKALGTGIGKTVSWKDLSIESDDAGKPFYVCSDELQQHLTNNNITNTHLSLCDEKNTAVAYAILETQPV
jgi:holo-[acyl-carrier protein] synthase